MVDVVRILRTCQGAIVRKTSTEVSVPDAGGVLDRLATAYGVPNDAQLSLALNVAKTTLSSWRTRNSVPYEICVQAYREGRGSLEWLLFGDGEPPSGVQEPSHAGGWPSKSSDENVNDALGRLKSSSRLVDQLLSDRDLQIGENLRQALYTIAFCEGVTADRVLVLVNAIKHELDGRKGRGNK